MMARGNGGWRMGQGRQRMGGGVNEDICISVNKKNKKGEKTFSIPK